MRNDKLSVIIPVYNVCDWLDQCIESILSPGCHSSEVILVDDGSTDGSLEICEKWSQDNESVKIIRTEHLGAANARKTGLRAATGGYVTFPDSDDWIEGDLYGQMMVKALEENADIVCSVSHICEAGSYSETVRQAIECGLYTGEGTNVLKRKLFAIAPSLCLKIFKKSCIKKYIEAVDSETRVSNDMAASYPAILNAKRIYVMNLSLYHYRMGHRQPSALGPIVKMNSYALTYLTIEREMGDWPELKRELDIWIWERVRSLVWGLENRKAMKIAREKPAVAKMLDRYNFLEKQDRSVIFFRLFKERKYALLLIIIRTGFCFTGRDRKR